MTVATYDTGDRVELYANFTDEDGDPTNPTAVSFKLKAPDGTVTTYTTGDLDNPSAGEWTREVDLDQTGLYWYRVAGTGTVVAAGEASLRVRGTSFA